ncbi:MAG TPA: hypothetical protein VK007_02850 [Acidimicrobiales bacterium]|nr:hypothetical protein [Acidimicrobiales bacterium]
MMTPPEFFASSTLRRFAHSALPDAPVRPERRRRIRVAAAARRIAARRRA